MSIPISLPSFSLNGKVAIITGGGTGIGRSIAEEFAKVGADVVVVGRRLAPLEDVAKEIKSFGTRTLAISADVTKKADVDNVVKKTLDEFGDIDILVNNASTNMGGGPSLLESDEDRWDQMINTNLKSVYLCCRAVGPVMRERKKGNIINVASIDGVVPAGSCRIYGISKAAVIFLTAGLSMDLGPHNVRVNSISPGYVKTDMIANLWTNPEALMDLENTVRLRRIGLPIDIASVALFLASDASNYITGQNIIVNAGGIEMQSKAVTAQLKK